jgi:hypothetical protein
MRRDDRIRLRHTVTDDLPPLLERLEELVPEAPDPAAQDDEEPGPRGSET